jgi:hypothetical protein
MNMVNSLLLLEFINSPLYCQQEATGPVFAQRFFNWQRGKSSSGGRLTSDTRVITKFREISREWIYISEIWHQAKFCARNFSESESSILFVPRDILRREVVKFCSFETWEILFPKYMLLWNCVIILRSGQFGGQKTPRYRRLCVLSA